LVTQASGFEPLERRIERWTTIKDLVVGAFADRGEIFALVDLPRAVGGVVKNVMSSASDRHT
jgi:hypothetical protein